MKIFAHDEDSMTNLFFSEVHRHEKLNDFLALIEWRDYSEMPFDISDVELHQQVNFSEFGRPDAIILVTDSQGQKHVVIVEVKLGKYLDSCISTGSGKFNNKFNSRLNNQLALKFRAMMSLSSLADKGYITELEHSEESPYSEDQVRRCKKPATISFSKRIVNDDLHFYLVTLTSDAASPVSEGKLALSDPCFPLFFNQHTESQQEYQNLGSVVWSQCHSLFKGVNNHFSESFKLHFDEASEELIKIANPTDLFVKGSKIIRFDGKTCHLSCRGGKPYSFAIRHFRNGQFIVIYRGENDREKYLGLKDQIEILGKAPSININDNPSWGTYFQKLQEGNK